MAVKEFPAGTQLIQSGQNLSALHVIAKGSVRATYPGGEFYLSKGDVIGVCEIFFGSYFISYQAEEATSLASYPCSPAQLSTFMRSNADMADKKQLIEVYGQAVEKSLAAIRYRGLDLEELDRLYTDRKLARTPMEHLVQEKEAVRKERSALEELSRELADWQSKLDREEGAIRHAKASYEAKFGEYIPLDMQAERLKPYIKEKKEQILALDGAGERQKDTGRAGKGR